MQRIPSPRTVLSGLTLAAVAGGFALTLGAHRVQQAIPERIADVDFWRMVTEMSEPGGYFHSDNFVSNEAAFQYVIPDLQTRLSPGGVYLGVGPDQNFTYLAAFHPRIAFIVDIRRQNMLQHLMYKALMELSVDRADFLSRLFSRARPEGLDSTTDVATLIETYAALPPDSVLFRRNLTAIDHHLLSTRGFKLTEDDLRTIEYVYGAFYGAGPGLTYSFGQGQNSFGGMGMPSYGYLQIETDGRGAQRSYLASERNYRVLRDLQTRNLIVPLVGDFAGDKVLREVGRYLKARGTNVSFFYTSNVEQYLFQQGDDWSRFYTNVSMLPMTDSSVFIRSVSNRRWVAIQNPNSRSAQLVSSIAEVIAAFRSGRLTSYFDLVRISR